MKGIWAWWQPVKELREFYRIVRCTQNRYSVEILLRSCRPDNGKEMRITFPLPIGGFRYTQESYRLNMDAEYDQPHGADTDFFKIENSKYIASIVHNSMSRFDNKKLIHYVVSDDNYIIDIAAFEDPMVTIEG